MSKLYKVVSVLLVVVVLLAAAGNVAYADKPNDNGKATAPGQVKKVVVAESNGSGDKAGGGESNGKNEARPDQDGVGMDRGEDNDDKQWDGNNGCGNDKLDPNSPGEDDNNGKCKGLNKGGGDKPPIVDEPPVVDEPEYPPVVDEPPMVDGPEYPPVDDWSRRVCFVSDGNAVEFFESIHDYDEDFVIGEGWNIHCEDLTKGVYVVRPWNSSWGHGSDAPRYVITVSEPGATVVVHNPFELGQVVDYGGVVVERSVSAYYIAY